MQKFKNTLWSGKCPFGEMSCWGNVQSGKCPSGKCPVGEVSVRGNVRRGSVHRGSVSREFVHRGSVSRGFVHRGSVQSGNCPTCRTVFSVFQYISPIARGSLLSSQIFTHTDLFIQIQILQP